MPWTSGLPTALARVPLATRTAASGLLAFSVCVLLPTLHRADRLGPAAFWLLGLAPLSLLVGIALSYRHGRVAVYVLLATFPTAIAISLSRFDHDTALATFSPVTLGFALASLGAYAASAIAL